MNGLLEKMGRPITDAVALTVEQDEATFGDPSTLLMHKRRMLQTVLEVAGLLKPGAVVEPQHVVMIDAAFATVGLSNAIKPDAALVRFIATGVAGAPVAGLHAYKKQDVPQQSAPRTHIGFRQPETSEAGDHETREMESQS